MSLSIMEALLNANYNLQNAIHAEGALNQLHVVCELLLKGYALKDKIEPLLEEYGTIDMVPERSE